MYKFFAGRVNCDFLATVCGMHLDFGWKTRWGRVFASKFSHFLVHNYSSWVALLACQQC